MSIKLNIALEEAEKTKKLQADLNTARKELAEFKRKFNELEFKYINEVKLNTECVDLLVQNGIAFRSYLSRKERNCI